MAVRKNKILVILCEKDREVKRYLGDSKSIVDKFAEVIGATTTKFSVSHPRSNKFYNKTIPAMNRLALEIGSHYRLKKIARGSNKDIATDSK